MNPFSCNRRMPARTRREFLELSSFGFGSLALSYLLQRDSLAMPGSVDPLAPRAVDFPAQAKHVIFVFLKGGPSHVDAFCSKPVRTRPVGLFLHLRVIYVT